MEKGKIVEGFFLGVGAAFGWALGNGLITLVIHLLGQGKGA